MYFPGQAGAIRLAISRALTSFSSDFLPQLQTGKMISSRTKEAIVNVVKQDYPFFKNEMNANLTKSFFTFVTLCSWTINSRHTTSGTEKTWSKES